MACGTRLGLPSWRRLGRERRGLEIGRPAQKSATAFIQRHGPLGGKCPGFEHKSFVLFQKQLASASGREAFDLSLGTLPEGTEPTEIIGPSLAEQENVDLVVRDADAASLEEIGDGSAAGAIESRQIVETIDRYRKVDVSTLVQDLDPVTSEGLKARNFTNQRPGQRAEQRDRAYLRDLCQIDRYYVCGAPEPELPRNHEAILFRDLLASTLAGHGFEGRS
jgi:hypothetical protein